MKNIISTLLLLFVLCFTACTNSEHNASNEKPLSFQGIVLGETIPDSVMRLLDSSDLSVSDYINIENETYYVNPLQGEFSLQGSDGLPINVRISVFRHPETRKVYKIMLNDLYVKDATELYKLFSAKYGFPNSPQNSEGFSFDDLRNIHESGSNTCYARWDNINSKNQCITFWPVEQLYFNRNWDIEIFKIEYIDTDVLDEVYSYFARSTAFEENERKKSVNAEQERLNNSELINQDF